MWDYNKRPNIHVIRESQKKREKVGQRSPQETMAENSPNLAKDINLQIQEAEQIPNRIKKSMPRHIPTLKTRPRESLESKRFGFQ